MPLDFNSFPMRERRKSQELAWDPLGIDLSRDKEDWGRLARVEQGFVLQMVVGFLIGERGVTHDLAPLQSALRQERGRMEEEMYLTTQLHEEAQHVVFFQNWLNETLPGVPGMDFPFPRTEGTLFKSLLPEVMGRLREDRSPEAQLRASVLYHMIVEGIIAEIGYQVFYGALEKRDLMPGLVQGIHYIHRDEARHIAFGLYFIQRLIRENPRLEPVFDEYMEEFRPVAEEMPVQIFADHPPDAIPFGLHPAQFREQGRQLFQSRIQQVKKGHLAAAGAALA